jgi:Arc/MetJ-type ribon-helix-helix transcriptional regulator
MSFSYPLMRVLKGSLIGVALCLGHLAGGARTATSTCVTAKAASLRYHPHGRQGADELSETEKITINLGLVDLGQIDLLVQEGFYQNRTDFIRTAIRNQLNTQAEAVKQTVARKELVLGLQHYARHDLEAVREAGETLEIRVLGLATIADDVPPELALETIDSIDVLGAFRASPDVKAALAGRIRST